jgi:aerobic-type carbon monoxide dehydrogenase small subunit (CoxS/CutS family)
MNSDEAKLSHELVFRINGRSRTLTVESRESLLDVLRERLALTGTKKGCNQGACGACTVLVDGERINACFGLADLIVLDGLSFGSPGRPRRSPSPGRAAP